MLLFLANADIISISHQLFLLHMSREIERIIDLNRHQSYVPVSRLFRNVDLRTTGVEPAALAIPVFTSGLPVQYLIR